MTEGYKFIDRIALALERTPGIVLDDSAAIPDMPLGALIEAAVLSQTSSAFESMLKRLTAQRDIIDALCSAKRAPMKPLYRQHDQETWGILALNDVQHGSLGPSLHGFYLKARQAMAFKGSAVKAKARLCGAVDEMVDNVIQHSNASHTGIVAFRATSERYEVVVADAGIVVLASLRSNPAFSFLSDAGLAMSLAMADGNSRFGPAEDRGYGFGTLFRALMTLDAELRFRSGDYAVEVSGRSPSLKDLHIVQKAQLRGFVVSVTLLL